MVVKSSVFEIRRLTKDDFDEWKKLWSVYLAFYDTSVNDLVYETTFGRLISKDYRGQNAIIASKNNQLVGLAHYIFHPDNWNIEDDCYLQDLFVVETFRGHGIGRSLIEGVYAEADKRGSPSVYWLTEKTNYRARALYDKLAYATSFIEYSRK
jgi:GNAT superfamily N-acetyltransferase